jgi:Fic-DOC domain mobile mystery protein B
MILGPPIPGETPIDDISGLKIKGIYTRRELNLAEAENIAEAVEKYLLGPPSAIDAPFDYTWVLQLHREMFGKVWDWAGIPRTQNKNIGVPYNRVEQLLYDLTLRLPYWKDLSFLEQSVRLHHQAVYIHPFENGNGRWSRMLANIWLYKNGCRVVKWPENLLGERSPVRQEYLECIMAADQNDLTRLIAMHERFVPPEE